jgi:cytochrome c oxidase assembly protein subunit 19
MANAFGGPRLQVKPPERGVFALDHDGECKPLMEKYLACLRGKQNLHFECRELSKLYLSCRMDKGLMAEENLSKLV